jgi:hypothetical protein
MPLVWDELQLAIPTWRRLLPETRDPRAVDWHVDLDWVIKPALGRVGDMVGVHGATAAEDWRAIRRSVRWHPQHWVAQRQFESLPVLVDGEPWHICLGVYTIDGHAAGIYGRAARQPLINHLACDVAVLLADPETTTACGPHPYDDSLQAV